MFIIMPLWMWIWAGVIGLIAESRIIQYILVGILGLVAVAVIASTFLPDKIPNEIDPAVCINTSENQESEIERNVRINALDASQILERNVRITTLGLDKPEKEIE